jgi:hypothetical protein
MVAELVTTGRIIDVILVLVVIEMFVLSSWHRRTGRGPALRALVPNLLAGAALLLAVRLALADAWWGWLAACLSAALVMHIADLAMRREAVS